jgi:hypothetical protein
MIRAGILVALLLVSGSVSARVIFPADFSPNATVQTFESLPIGPQPNPLTLGGVTFTDPNFLGVDDASADFANQQTPGSSMRTLFASYGSSTPLIIDFASPVDRAGLLLSSSGSLMWIVYALSPPFMVGGQTFSNVLGSTFVEPPPGQAGFGGFEDFTGIGQLQIVTVGPNPLGLLPHFDDLRYERVAVSEPGTAPLFGAGAALLLVLDVIVRRRKRC